jgi:hypothetical protein
MIQTRRLQTEIFSAALLTVLTTVPVLAAPSAPVPMTEVKVTAVASPLKPTTAKLLVPVTPMSAAKTDKRFVKRSTDYRFSNPSRWHSDMTANSIRNQ